MTLREATITNVKNEGGIILLSVQFNDGSSRSNVAFGKIGSDSFFVPREGDVVAVDETTDGNHIAISVISRSEHDTTEASQGDFAFQLDNENLIKATKNSNGGFDVTIDVEGDVVINSEGDIMIGNDGTKVAKQDHTHPVSWTDEAGSGDTGTPNEEGTNTKIE